MEGGVRDLLTQCSLPDDTELQEHTLKTSRGIVIGDRCTIDYGLRGDEIIVCEFSSINGSIEADSDVRIDNFCEVVGDVITEQDAYLGEGVKIRGRLIVAGDLDIGDNVQIEKGFEAKGWISIRNPMPVIAYLILYLVTLLGLEKEEEINALMEKLFGSDEEEQKTPEIPLVIPAHSTLTMETFSVPGKIVIGDRCRLHGNIRAEVIEAGEESLVFGSLRADNSVVIGMNTTVHGDVVAGGAVTVKVGCHILGNIRCGSLELHEEALIDGIIKAPEGVRIERVP